MTTCEPLQQNQLQLKTLIYFSAKLLW